MKKIVSAIICSLLSTVAIADNKAEIDTLKSTVAAFMQKNQIPGVAVNLYRDGHAENYYFGYANLEKKKPVSAKTIFEVGSITKLMTALLLAQQVDSAKAQLDQSITNYLPELPASYEDMTLQNLATHTAGFPRDLPDNVHTSNDLTAYLSIWQPSYSADEKWHYSNVGIGMLGLALEKMTHQPIEKLYINDIDKPLHMQTCRLNVAKQDKKWLATGYDQTGHALSASPVSILPAGGDLKISAASMQQFLSAAIGLPGTPETILYPMRMTQSAYVELNNRKQGLGWQIHSLQPDDIAELLSPQGPSSNLPERIVETYEAGKFDGNSLIDKTGTTDGFRAYIAVIPNKKTGIVILANRRLANNDIVKLGRDILFKLNHIEAKPETVESDDEENDEY